MGRNAQGEKQSENRRTGPFVCLVLKDRGRKRTPQKKKNCYRSRMRTESAIIGENSREIINVRH